MSTESNTESPAIKQPLFQVIASLLLAIENCQKTGNKEWEVRHKERLHKLVKEYLPSGAGFDNGTSLDFLSSTPKKLVFNTDFHHMNDEGVYDGWTKHTVTVRPSLVYGFDLVVSGSDRNHIKDLIWDSFYFALEREITISNPKRLETT